MNNMTTKAFYIIVLICLLNSPLALVHKVAAIFHLMILPTPDRIPMRQWTKMMVFVMVLIMGMQRFTILQMRLHHLQV